jgi:hypothetical protein
MNLKHLPLAIFQKPQQVLSCWGFWRLVRTVLENTEQMLGIFVGCGCLGCGNSVGFD